MDGGGSIPMANINRGGDVTMNDITVFTSYLLILTAYSYLVILDGKIGDDALWNTL